MKKFYKYRKFITIISTLFSLGCSSRDVIILKPPDIKTPVETIEIPTIEDNQEIVVCYDPRLEKFKDIVKDQCKSRFKRFVAIMLRGEINKNGEWVAHFPDHDSLVSDVQMLASVIYPGNCEIILWIDNPTDKVLSTYTNVWYFKKKIWSIDKLEVSIWDIISTPKVK